jgi:hypothetical protein
VWSWEGVGLIMLMRMLTSLKWRWMTCPFMWGNSLGHGPTPRPPMVGHHSGVGRYQASGLGFDSQVRLMGLGWEVVNADQRGSWNGAPGDLSAHPLCEGVGRGFPLAHALEGKRVNPEFTPHPTLSFQCSPKGSNLVLLSGGLGWESVGG